MTPQAIAADLNLIADAVLLLEPEFTCAHCGRVYDEPIPTTGCFSDDCPGHDIGVPIATAADEQAYWEELADELEEERRPVKVRKMKRHW